MRRKIPFAPVPPVPRESFSITLDQIGHVLASVTTSAVMTMYLGKLCMRTAQLGPEDPDPTPEECEQMMREAFDAPIDMLYEDNPFRAWLIRYRDNQAVAIVNPKPLMRVL